MTSSSLSTRKVGARELSRKEDGFGRAVHTNEVTCSVMSLWMCKGFKRPSVETASVKV